MLAANPNATLNDFYGEYFGGTGTPGALGASGYSLWPGGSAAQNNWANVLNSNGLSPNTPLASVIGLNTGQTPSSTTSSIAGDGGIGSDAVAGGLFGTNTNTIGPTGSGVTTLIGPGSEDVGNTFDDTPNLTDSDFAGLTDADIMGTGSSAGTALGQGGIGSDAVAGGTAGTTGTPLPGQQNTGEASIAGGAVQKGLGTAGTDVENAAGGIAGTLASTINSIEQYTSSAFVIAALVVLGAIMLAYGLGLFKHGVSIPVPIPV